ncbi:MAG TPA: hypothetical protein VGR71_10130, partial [Nitrospira sp.]|nr:hypothetical protein [Nitrospira sp.]
MGKSSNPKAVRAGIWRSSKWSAGAIGAAAPPTVIVLLLVTPPSAAIHSGLPMMYATTFSAFSANVSSQNSTPCRGNHASAAQAPFYNSSTGAIGFILSAVSANFPHFCYNWRGAYATASIVLTGPKFSVASSGAYVVRTDWNMSWRMAVWGPVANGTVLYSEQAQAYVFVNVWLVDRTTGEWWGSPATYGTMECTPYFVTGSHVYDNQSCIKYGGSGNRSFQHNVSFPFVAPMSVGHMYQLQVTLYGQVLTEVVNSSYVAHAALN